MKHIHTSSEGMFIAGIRAIDVSLKKFNPSPLITYILIAITVAVSFYAWSKPALLAKLIMNPYQIERQQQYYRFVTSGFIHKDHMHLLFNMLSFYFFGLSIEYIFNDHFGSAGNMYFLALYLLGVIVSDIPSYFKHKDNPGYNSLGASGGVSAVVFVFIILNPLASIYLYFAIPVPGFIMGVLFIGFSYYQSKQGKGTVNHSAHLYGALFGLLFCLVFYPSSLPVFVAKVMGQISHWLN
jgi:membrane associated rhomboid family serine protease